jgi:hypothetical protein
MRWLLGAVQLGRLILILGAAGFILSQTHAQRVSVGYQRQDWGQAELQAVHAGSVRLTWERGIEFTAEVGGSAWDGIGVTCGGFIPGPDQCANEAQDISASALVVGAGWDLPVREGSAGTVSIVPGIGLALLTFKKEGRETGQKISDSLVQAEVGIALRYVSASVWEERVRLLVEARVTGGTSREGGCEDCYDVLEGSASRKLLTVGVAFGG